VQQTARLHTRFLAGGRPPPPVWLSLWHRSHDICVPRVRDAFKISRSASRSCSLWLTSAMWLPPNSWLIATSNPLDVAIGNLLPRLVLALPNPLLCALLLLLEPGLLWHPVGWVAPPRPRSDSSSAPSDFPPSPVSTAGASLRWNFENAESPSGS
jgi:hypothetical protein